MSDTITVVETTVEILEVSTPGPQGTRGLPGEDAPTFARRHAYSAPYSYCGSALSGSADSSPVWTIQRINVAANGTTTTGTATNVAWTARAGATYT